MYKTKIDNKEVVVRDGFTINEEMNETLDSGVVQFLSEGGEKDIESFDSIVFEENPEFHTSRKTLLIDTFNNEIVNFKDSLKDSDYLYLTNLFSETKLLERITCPSLTITSRAYGVQKKVWEKVKEYCLAYLPRIYVYDQENAKRKVLKCRYKYDRALEEVLNVPCPEMSWENPTLREVLTDLFQVANLLPIIKDNVLTYIDLNYRGNEIDQTKLTDSRSSMSSADYCDELTIPMQNVVKEGTYKTLTEFVTPRTLDSSEMTTQNMCLITQKPIYNIKSIKVYAGGIVQNESGTRLVDVDLIGGAHNFVLEENEYNLLSPRTIRIDGNSDPANYRIFHLHYKRGDNVISNVGESISFKILNNPTEQVYDRLTLAFASARSRNAGFSSVNNIFGFGISNTSIRKVIFKIEYETIEESTIIVSKNNQVKNPANRLFDGQTSPTVNLRNQTIHEYLKVNRLGNKVKTIFGEYTDEREIPQLADTIGSKVLFSRSLTYYDNIIYFKGQLTENYILRDYFTGVHSRRRAYALATEQESVVRHDVVKLYATASFNHQRVKVIDEDTPYSIIGGDFFHLVDAFDTSKFRNKEYNLNYVGSKFFGKTSISQTGSIPAGNDYLLSDSNFTVVGKSFVCDFNFIDNAIAGYSIERQEDNAEFMNNIVKYVDINGEATSQNIVLSNYLEQSETGAFGEFEQDMAYLSTAEGWEDGHATWNKINSLLNRRPLINYSAFRSAGIEIARKYLFKDNRENIKTTLQIEYVSDDKDIILTDYLASNCPLYNQSSDYNFRSCEVYKLTGDKYSPNETVARGELVEGASVRLINVGGATPNDSYQVVSIVGLNIGENDSYCVCNDWGNILFAVNTNKNYVIFEMRYTKDNNVYNSIVDRVRIGKTNEIEVLEREYEFNPPKIHSIKTLGRTIDESDFKDFN